MEKKLTDEKTKAFAAEIRKSAYVAWYLSSKGYGTKEAFDKYINAKVASLRHVYTLKDSDRFLERLSLAIDRKEVITIYGDYDCDGIMATAIVMFSLQNIGENTVHWFINDRFKEGYGMNVKGAERLLKTFPDTQLVITVDNGIKANEGVSYLKAKNVDVIISDHHKQSEGEELPDCPVVCESRLDENEEIKENFCGAELARRLMSELYIMRNLVDSNRTFLNGLCAYSGFATITDSVPMNAANHCIAKTGLRLIERGYDTVWQVLNQELNQTRITQDTIGFTYGPMFNAPGRVLGNVDAAMEVLVASRSGNIDRAREAVQKLIAINEERKTWSKEDDSLAFKQAENYSDNRFMLVANDSFREGINGLTSSHLTEKYQVPSIVLSPVHGSANIYKGSGRSVDGINLFSILDQCRDLMLGFGGHPMAAGLSVEKKNIEKLRKRLNKLAPENPDKGAVTADFTVDPSDITLDLIDEYETLMPFGPEFEKPTFLIEGRIESIRTMKDKHIKIGLETANGGAYTIMDILWWNCMEQYKELGTELKPGDTISVLGTPEASTFNNERRIQMVADKVNLY